MWELLPTEEFKARYRQYEKKRPRELSAVLVNQETYLAALRAGTNPLQIKFGFVHVEKHGVVALDQRRGGGKLAQTRLYLYPDTVERILYQVILGDKNTQQQDIQLCNWFVAQLRKREAQDDGSAKGQPREGGREEAIQERPGDGPRPV